MTVVGTQLDITDFAAPTTQEVKFRSGTRQIGELTDGIENMILDAYVRTGILELRENGFSFVMASPFLLGTNAWVDPYRLIWHSFSLGKGSRFECLYAARTLRVAHRHQMDSRNVDKSEVVEEVTPEEDDGSIQWGDILEPGAVYNCLMPTLPLLGSAAGFKTPLQNELAASAALNLIAAWFARHTS